MTPQLSKTINFLRFPLILAVIFNHNYSNDFISKGELLEINMNASFYEAITYLFSNILGKLSVPISFFISGYFYFKSQGLSHNSYLMKNRAKVRSLLIPYLFWNIVLLFIYGAGQHFAIRSGYNSNAAKLIFDYDWSDFINAFWCGMEGKYPFVYQFWFIRDLMVLCLISPFVFLLAKKGKGITVIGVGLLWWFDFWPIEIPSSRAFFFFLFGCYSVIYKRNDMDSFQTTISKLSIIYPLVVCCDLASKGMDFNPNIHRAGVLLGVIFLLNLVSLLMLKSEFSFSQTLSNANFFVYALHEPLLSLIRKTVFKIAEPTNELVLVLLYFIIPITTAMILVLFYQTGVKFFPRVMKVACGGR